MSGVSGVVDALVAVFGAVVPASVTVIDGGPYDPPAGRSLLCVGWAGPDNSGGSVGYASPPRTEDVAEVLCLLSTRDGSEDASLSAVRAEVDASFATLRAALAADPKLGGAAIYAWSPGYDYLPDTSDEGFLVQLRFTVFAQLMP